MCTKLARITFRTCKKKCCVHLCHLIDQNRALKIPAFLSKNFHVEAKTLGLSQNTIKPEDHAVDLRLIKEILNSAHAKIMVPAWKNFLLGYKSVVGNANYVKITKLVSDIESRGRYAQVV